MSRSDVNVLIKLFEEFENFYKKDNLLVATYVYFRYGLKFFNEQIKTNELDIISKEILSNDNLFNMELNLKIDKILGK